MKSSKDKRPPLMVRVWAELGKGKIEERFLLDRKLFTDGFIDGEQIYINPIYQTVDTILHELLHRLQPEWSEAYVRNRTTFLRRRMTDEEIQEFYRIYEQSRKKRKTPKDVT